MSKMRRYQCPDCSGQFDYLHHPNMESDPAPRFCPLCGFDTADDGHEDVICSPGLLKGKAKGVDNIYKAEEEGSNFRAQKAMEMGLDASEAASLKITNMRDNAKYGETSDVPLNNSVTQAMAQQPNAYGFQGSNQQAVGYSQQAHVNPATGRLLPGKERNAGLRAASLLKSSHQAQGHVTSDAPALETQMPGYRRRL